MHRDGHVELAKAYYHVPPEYLRHELWVRYDSRQVRLFAQQKDCTLKPTIAHRCHEPGQFTNPRGLGGVYAPGGSQPA